MAGGGQMVPGSLGSESSGKMEVELTEHTSLKEARKPGYRQELGDFGDFVFTENEAMLMRLLECIRYVRK